MTDRAKVRVLVLCTHNANRSQMAEGILRALGKDRLEVFSAGTDPREVNAYAIKVLAEIGIDISKHHAKNVSDFLGQEFDFVITVCDTAAQNCPSFPGHATRLHWPFQDPTQFTGTEEEITTQYRRLRDQIKQKISEWLAELPF